MPAITCPLPGCDYATEDVDAVAAAAQLNLHALIHQRQSVGTSAHSTKQKPPKIDRPSVSFGSTEEQWNTFLKRWSLFKQGTEIPNGQLVSQLWQCCDNDLEEDLFKDVNNLSTITEDELLCAIKRLAVVTKARSVRKTELFSMKQDHGQPIRTFAAKIKGKAQVCVLSKQCTNANCNQVVDYSEDIVKYVLISGIADEEIKKDVLGHENLDSKTLNETISIIENKEMAVRAMNATVSVDSAMAVHNDAYKRSNQNPDPKLTIKVQCKTCPRQIFKFKLRKGNYKQFSHCVQCWRKLHSDDSGDKQGAIFDVVGAVSSADSSSSPAPCKSKKNARPRLVIKHHIFDGTYGWMVKESRKQPTIKVELSTNSTDYDFVKAPCPKIRPRKVSVVTDSGAQSSLIGLKLFLSLGFKMSDILPVEKRLYAANNEGINVLGAVFVRLSGIAPNGQTLQAAEMIYVSDSTEMFYMSLNAMEQLKIVPANFPTVGSAAAISDPCSSYTPTTESNSKPIPHNSCECLPRSAPPPRPDHLPFEVCEENNDKMKQWLLDRYAASTFNQCPHQPLPLMSCEPIQISIAEGVTPTAIHTPATIPIHWREEVKQQLDDDVALGVIEKVEPNTPTTWCHRAIWVRKPDGSPRRVVDFQSLNKHCMRNTHHTVPPFHQARAIPAKTYRSVTDAWNGYHSVPVREEDRHMLTFITEYGRYRYKAAPQGFMASGDGYTHRYDRIIADIPRKTKCVDDTAMWDAELADHWWRMIDYLYLVGKEGVTLNPKKFQFGQKVIDFAGFRVTEDEVKPLPKYIDTIRSFPQPKSIKDIRAWFGLVNQVSHYNKLIDIMAPFKPYLSPKTPFVWTAELNEAFQRSKEEIVDAIKEGVKIFDPKRRTCLCPDYSRTGIGYWLRQKFCSCDSYKPDCCSSGWRITLSGSRFCRDNEKRYHPIEGEALAIAWALEDSKYFTMGCDDLVVVTDHNPLVKIFGDRALDEISNTRIFNLKQNTLPWRFKIFHVPGRCIPSSDTTSRNPLPSPLDETATEWLLEERHALVSSVDDSDVDGDIVAAVTSSLNKICAVTWDRVKEATKSDLDLQQLIMYVIDGFPENSASLPTSLQCFWRFRDSLLVVDDVILFDDRVVIPTSLRSEVCKILHSAHQGTNSMIERAKSTVFWPGITNAIYKQRENCDTCWRMAPSQSHLPPAEPIVPTAPFQAIATDYCEKNGYHYLITVDRFSNWPEIIKVSPGSHNSGASGLLRALRRYFATFGVPEELSSDGGPEFVAKETESFLQRWGIKHRQSSAYNPRSNGRAECAVKSMKRLLESNVSLNGDIDNESFTAAILQFRNTRDPSSGTSPAEVIFGHPIRDTLPIKPRSQVFHNLDVRPVWRDVWQRREDALRTRLARQAESLNVKTKSLPPLAVGDTCRIQNQNGQFPKKWDRTGTVVQINNNDQYVLKVDGSGRLTLRNRRYLRKFSPLNNQRTSSVTFPYNFSATGNDTTETISLSPDDPVALNDEPVAAKDCNPDFAVADTFGGSLLSEGEKNKEASNPLATATTLPVDSESTELIRDNASTRRSTRSRKIPAWQKDYIMDS